MTPLGKDLSVTFRTLLRVIAISLGCALFLTGSIYAGYRLVRTFYADDERTAFLIGQPLGILFVVLVGLGVTVFRQSRRDRLAREAAGHP